MHRLTVPFRLAFESYRFLLTNLHHLWKLATIRLVTALTSASLIEWMSLEIEDQWLDMKFSGKFFLFAFAKILVYVITFSSVATTWHRAALQQEGLKEALTPKLDTTSRRYALHSLLLSGSILITIAIALFSTNTLAAALAPLASQEEKVASRLITMPTLLFILVTSCKWLPTLPSLAVSKIPDQPWKLEWRNIPLSSAVSLFILCLATLAPLALISKQILQFASNSNIWSQIPLVLLSELVMGCALLCFLAGLSLHLHKIQNPH
jgi:hypothetical protein